MTPEEFKQHRSNLGWTQKEAGQALGVSIQQISAIENGRSAVTATVGYLFSLYRFPDKPGRPSLNEYDL